MSADKATPRPWTWGEMLSNDHFRVLGTKAQSVLIHQAHWPVSEANAALIVRSVNQAEHVAALVAQVREAIAILEHGTDYERMHVSGVLVQGLLPFTEDGS